MDRCLGVLRYFNLYGNPAPWSHQKTMILSIISFLNVSKYPCSLSLFVHEAEFAMYGSVPFFYYILYFCLVRSFNITIFFAERFQQTDIPPQAY